MPGCKSMCAQAAVPTIADGRLGNNGSNRMMVLMESITYKDRVGLIQRWQLESDPLASCTNR